MIRIIGISSWTYLAVALGFLSSDMSLSQADGWLGQTHTNATEIRIPELKIIGRISFRVSHTHVWIDCRSVHGDE